VGGGPHAVKMRFVEVKGATSAALHLSHRIESGACALSKAAKLRVAVLVEQGHATPPPAALKGCSSASGTSDTSGECCAASVRSNDNSA
jgi:hypothetical protein